MAYEAQLFAIYIIEFKSQLLYEHLETAQNKYYEMSHLTITYERLFSFYFFKQEVEPSKQLHPKECSSGGLS